MAQPMAKARRAEPVITGSAAPAKTTSIRKKAPTRPVATEPATMRPIGRPEMASLGEGEVMAAGWSVRAWMMLIWCSSLVVGVAVPIGPTQGRNVRATWPPVCTMRFRRSV